MLDYQDKRFAGMGGQDLRTPWTRDGADSADKPPLSLKESPNLVGSPIAATHPVLLDDTRLNDVTGTILAGAIEVHRILGPGLFESTYGPCLQFELQARGLPFLVQPPIDVVYKSLQLRSVYRADLIVDDMVVVEIKAVEALTSLHRSQLLTYVRLARKLRGC